MEAALGRKAGLPARKICTVEEFLRPFSRGQEVWGDGPERPIRRPTGKDASKPDDSGKKKGHRVKNIVITRPTKRVRVVSDTFGGHPPDQTGANEQGLFDTIPSSVRMHLDLGFFGGPKEHPQGTFSLPENKPRGGTLSAEAKARRRVRVEHALGGVERFRTITEVLRNSRPTLQTA